MADFTGVGMTAITLVDCQGRVSLINVSTVDRRVFKFVQWVETEILQKWGWQCGIVKTWWRC